LFQEVMRNVDLMLQHDLIHGDLSAYNILYWKRGESPGEVTLIDFPQVVNLHTNDKAHFILQRDIQRTCQYFAQQGVQCDARAIMDGLWHHYVGEPDPEDLAADWSRLAADLDELSMGVALDPALAREL
jgi:RIO kinase 1